MYTLRAATPETASWPFQWGPPTGQAACGRLITPLSTHMKYASGEWGRNSKTRGVKKKRKEREEENAWAYGRAT